MTSISRGKHTTARDLFAHSLTKGPIGPHKIGHQYLPIKERGTSLSQQRIQHTDLGKGGADCVSKGLKKTQREK